MLLKIIPSTIDKGFVTLVLKMGEPAERIAIIDLQKRRGEAVIVDDITLRVHEGEIFALIGETNSGKTLITKMCLNLVKKSDGRIVVVGEDNQKKFTRNIQNIGSVIGQQNFYPEYTGYKTIEHYAMLNLQPVSRARIINILNLLGLKKVMHWTVSRYNNSRLQRLKIAVALVARPSVLILDEPFIDLTTDEAHAVRIILRGLADNLHTAILITSPTLYGVEEICDTIGIIHDGIMVTTKSFNEMTAADAPYTKVSITTAVPNYAAQLIEEKLGLEAFICGSDVIIDTSPKNAQAIADMLEENDIKVLNVARVNRPLQEQYYEIIRWRGAL